MLRGDDGLIKKTARLIFAAYYRFMRVFPIQKNKVTAACFNGKKYGDNIKYILEEFHRLCPEAEIVL